ncbi:hemerythrin domain-containing protein [uncultured Rikenella sp.]|uniref:hemerythrin domain-containing protein n=1 Tax=uncultured Rikenella sp. TaxID=368003 RepID=UPI00261ADF13|nr:hemerythrin domain-containing protein [uncultured Rikenella sp.]
MKHLLFSERMKMADLIHANYRLLFVLPRFGIQLGFGDKSIGEVCLMHGISTRLFLLVCNIYTFDDFLPDASELHSFTAEDLTDYLHNSHADYTREQIPEIRRQVLALIGCCEAKNGRILERFFDDYNREVTRHFNYEETVVFPYIHNLSEGEKSDEGYSIGQFEKNHSNIEEKLGDLKNILIKYLPDMCPGSARNKLLLDLYLLEDDLNKHSLIEDRILVPLVEQLEERMR